MRDTSIKNKELIQESLYEFPYHYLPREVKPGVWHVGSYLHWGYEYLALIEIVSQLVLKHSPHRILDFGCGDGRLIRELLKRYTDLQIIGLDISERAIAFANAFYLGDKRVKLCRNISEIDPKWLPVDVVVAVEVLEHIPPHLLTETIDAIASVLRPDGAFIVSVPTINVKTNPKHYQHFSLHSLLAYMDGKFELIEHHYIHRVGLFDRLIRRAVCNRLFVANNHLWLRFTTWLYKKLVMYATPQTGAHLVTVFRLGRDVQGS